MAISSQRFAAPLDRAREGCNPPRTRRRRKRDLGSLGEEARQASVEDRGGYDT